MVLWLNHTLILALCASESVDLTAICLIQHCAKNNNQKKKKKQLQIGNVFKSAYPHLKP